MCSFFYALSVLPISDATALSFTNVPLTAIMASLILSEKYGWTDAVTAILCMVGVVFIAQPSVIFGGSAGGELPVFAVAICLFGACTSALAYVTVRQLPSADALVLVLYFSVVGSILTPVLLLTFQTPVALADPVEWALVAAVGVCGFLGQALLNRGIQLAPAGPATVMRYSDVVFALCYQTFLFNNPPSGLKLLGAGLIMSCVVGVLANARKKEHAKAATQEVSATTVEPESGGEDSQDGS